MVVREQCSFVLVRYVPDPVRNEFVNIGVVLRGEAGTRVRFTRDWTRVRCVDQGADTAVLEALETEMRERLELGAGGAGEKPMMALLEDSLSTGLQLSDAKVCLADSMAAELDELMRMYVERPRTLAEARPERGRAALQRRMRGEFEKAGVWEMLRKRIPAAEYTRRGDPLRIDCGYRPNGVIRMFQSVTLAAETDAAKVLAYTMPLLSAGVRRVESADLHFTAVVEPLREISTDEDEAAERYRFSVETMEGAGVRVMTANDLPRIAETAARELGL